MYTRGHEDDKNSSGPAINSEHSQEELSVEGDGGLLEMAESVYNGGNQWPRRRCGKMRF